MNALQTSLAAQGAREDFTAEKLADAVTATHLGGGEYCVDHQFVTGAGTANELRCMCPRYLRAAANATRPPAISAPRTPRRARKKLNAPTPAEAEALAWAKANYRHWRKRFSDTPDDLPDGYRAFFWLPFGVPAWNRYVHLVRCYLERTAGYHYVRPAPAVLATLEGNPPETRADAAAEVTP